MSKPKRVAQSLPDKDGNTVTYYVMYSEERDRYMIEVQFTDRMDTAYLQALILSFLDDCIAVNQDMFNMVAIDEEKNLH